MPNVDLVRDVSGKRTMALTAQPFFFFFNNHLHYATNLHLKGFLK